jgi:hypothetical protein
MERKMDISKPMDKGSNTKEYSFLCETNKSNHSFSACKELSYRFQQYSTKYSTIILAYLHQHSNGHWTHTTGNGSDQTALIIALHINKAIQIITEA